MTAAKQKFHRKPYTASDGREPYVPLPATRADIALYVQQLLSPKEREVCDLATD